MAYVPASRYVDKRGDSMSGNLSVTGTVAATSALQTGLGFVATNADIAMYPYAGNLDLHFTNAAWDATRRRIEVGTPTSGPHAATKAYVDARAPVLAYGPFSVTSAAIAAGADVTTTYTHGLGVTPSLVLFSQEDGSWSALAVTRVARTSTQVQFVSHNFHASQAATVVYRFMIFV